MKWPPIIVTRAEPGCTATAARITALGFTAIRSPVLTLHTIPDTVLCAHDRLSGLIFTSAAAVRFLTQRRHHDQYRTLPVWCVGTATAIAAHQAGFALIRESKGTAQNLIDMIATRARAATKPLLHIANAAAGETLAHQLTARGFSTRFAALYEARQAHTLNDQTITILNNDQPAIVLIHSAMGGAALCTLAEGIRANHLQAIAISAKAAQALVKTMFAAIHIAPAPDEDNLLHMVQSVMAQPPWAGAQK